MKFVVPLIGTGKTATVNLQLPDPESAVIHGNRSDALPMCGSAPPVLMAGQNRPDRITCQDCLEAVDVEKVAQRLRAK